MTTPTPSRLRRLWRARRKAIAGAIVPIATFVAARHGLELDATTAALIATAVTGVAVHEIPNAA